MLPVLEASRPTRSQQGVPTAPDANQVNFLGLRVEVSWCVATPGCYPPLESPQIL